MNRLVEVRWYKLKPGTGARFHEIVVSQSIPLLAACGMEVVNYGPSAADADAYFLMRAFDSKEHMQSSEDGFYSSDAWRNGPRESILACIESYGDFLLWLSPKAVAEMRNSQGLSGA